MKQRSYAIATWLMPALVMALVLTAPAHAQDFVALLNQARAARGLGPVAYNAQAVVVARQNNAAQMARGLGHWVLGGFGQCSAVGFNDAASALFAWTNSPGHAAIIFAPSLASVGFDTMGGCCTVSTTDGLAAVPIYGAVYQPTWTWTYPVRRGRRW